MNIRPLAKDIVTLYDSPDPQLVFCCSPAIVRLEGGRLVLAGQGLYLWEDGDRRRQPGGAQPLGRRTGEASARRQPDHIPPGRTFP